MVACVQPIWPLLRYISHAESRENFIPHTFTKLVLLSQLKWESVAVAQSLSQSFLQSAARNVSFQHPGPVPSGNLATVAGMYMNSWRAIHVISAVQVSSLKRLSVTHIIMIK